MRIIVAVAISFFLAASSCAADCEIVPPRPLNNRRLMTALRAAGCAPTGIHTRGPRHWIAYSGKCDVGPIVAAHGAYVDPEIAKKALEDELDALDLLVEKNIATAAQMRRIRQIERKLTKWAP